MPRGRYDRSLDKARRWGLQRAALHDAMAEVLLRLGVEEPSRTCALPRGWAEIPSTPTTEVWLKPVKSL